MKKNNPNNLPIYKRFEYRLIDFLTTSGYRMMQENLHPDVYQDIKKPISEIKFILNESMFGDTYKTKRKKDSSGFIHISVASTDLTKRFEKNNEQASPELTRKWIKKIQASWDDVDGGEL